MVFFVLTLPAGCSPQIVSLPVATPAIVEPTCRGPGIALVVHGNSSDVTRPVWVDRAGLRHDVTWPPGFAARFNPQVEVLGPQRDVVLREGDDLNALAAMGYYIGCPVDGRIRVLDLGASGLADGLDAMEIERAIEFRKEFGLASDLGTVHAVARDPASSMELGVPLTHAEVAVINDRHAIASHLEPLLVALKKDPRFGGLYIEQSEGGLIHIAVTSSDSAMLKVIENLVPFGAASTIDPVAYSLLELEATRTQVDTGFEDLSDEFGVNQIGIDLRANRVEIGIDPYTDANAAALIDRFGPQVRVNHSR